VETPKYTKDEVYYIRISFALSRLFYTGHKILASYVCENVSKSFRTQSITKYTLTLIITN